MDPISQGVLGALLPQALAKPESIRKASILGIAGGMAADLDVLIRSSHDQLLQVEYHRHFSHSLLFIPVGGLIVGAAMWPLMKKHVSFKESFKWATLGYATAGLLDACTSYGTRLLWPFSDARIAWDLISIIDPVFTVTAVVLALIAARRRSPGIARWAWVFIFCYLGLGLFQQQRAQTVALELAESRGDQVERIVVKPSIANLILWRSTYLTKSGEIQADAVRPGIFGDDMTYEGERCDLVTVDSAAAEAKVGTQMRTDIERFAHFSDGWLGWHPTEAHVLGDMRYAMLPGDIEPLWGIKLNFARPQDHVRWVTFRNLDEASRSRLWKMLLGDEIKQE